MNLLAHIFLTYFVASFVIPNAHKYLLAIALFSIILDLDHQPGFVKVARMQKKDLSGWTAKEVVDTFRSDVQEPIGVLTIETIFLFLYLFGVRHIILGVAALAVFLHWLIDFLTVHTRPLAPLDNRIVSVFFHTKRQRIMSEAVITLVSAVLFLVVYL